MIATIWPGRTARRRRRRVTWASTLPTGDRDALGQAGPLGALAPSGSRPCRRAATARWPSLAVKPGELRVERGQELLGRVGAVLVDALVAGGADVARLGAAQLPDDPVGRLDPPVGQRVELRVLLQQLEPLANAHSDEILPPYRRQPRFPLEAASSLIRSAWACAAWCFHSLGQACGRSGNRSFRGVPSARAGRMVQAVKSVAMPITSSGDTPADSTAFGTAMRSTSRQSSGDWRAQSGWGRRSHLGRTHERRSRARPRPGPGPRRPGRKGCRSRLPPHICHRSRVAPVVTMRRWRRMKIRSNRPMTILVHQELRVPSKLMTVWISPSTSTPRTVPSR